MERRLAAVMAIDMVEYSRLVRADEQDILVRQRHHRHALIEPLVSHHQGRIVKTTGDGMLVEFSSAQDAVHCAIAI